MDDVTIDFVVLTQRRHVKSSHAPENSHIHFCLVGAELSGDDVSTRWEFCVTRGCVEVSVKTCRAEGANHLWENGSIEGPVISEARQWTQLSHHL